MHIRYSSRRDGQTMVELALVMPLFIMVVVGIIVLGIGVFYNQQLSNAAREAAGSQRSTAPPPSARRKELSAASPPEGYPFTGM